MSDAAIGVTPAWPPARQLYPQRAERRDHWLDRIGKVLAGAVILPVPGLYLGRPSRIVRLVAAEAPRFEGLAAGGLSSAVAEVRRELRRTQLGEAAVARAFALIREVASPTIGLRHFDVQLIGGFALLKGAVAEMDTGEGKTLTATLPAATAALAGIPVHVVTVNDYLAERDAAWMGKLYTCLGLTVGVVTHGMSHDARRAAYGCDVVYCTNKQLAFDYLRDRMVLGQEAGNLRLKFEQLYGDDSRSRRLLLRGLHFAIIDEADSVLIDEARTPLIISGETDSEAEQLSAVQAIALANKLVQDRDYRVVRDQRRVELYARGKDRLAEIAAPLGGMWKIAVVREEMARMALTAWHLFHRDEHYLVREGKVQIVDEFTGRVMADRYWSRDLHQLIEVKEGCEVTGHRLTLGRITYQRLFCRYQRLAGMTGTAREVAGELWAVFGLPVYRVRTNRPVRRTYAPEVVCANLDTKWRMLTALVQRLHDEGRAVLVGTRSVAASETASRHLEAAWLAHVVLNAAQDGAEAEIIAVAGEPGRVTVATNMAGRGTDIKLAPGVAARGGLVVIMTERHESARIDRQLAGRCGRQGDPGEVHAVFSIEDPVLDFAGNGPFVRVLLLFSSVPSLGTVCARAALRRAQRRAERTHSKMRRDLLKLDRSLSRTLAFAGALE